MNTLIKMTVLIKPRNLRNHKSSSPRLSTSNIVKNRVIWKFTWEVHCITGKGKPDIHLRMYTMNIPVCSWTALLVQIPDQRIRPVHVRYGRVKKVLRQTLGRCSNQEGVDPCVTNSETNTNNLTYNIYVKSLNELLNAHYYHLIKLCPSGWTAGFSVNGRFSLPSDIHRSIMYAFHR